MPDWKKLLQERVDALHAHLGIIIVAGVASASIAGMVLTLLAAKPTDHPRQRENPASHVEQRLKNLIEARRHQQALDGGSATVCRCHPSSHRPAEDD